MFWSSSNMNLWVKCACPPIAMPSVVCKYCVWDSSYIIKQSFYQRLSSELGSGEFGVVRRGVWSVGGEEREVAVKSLADGSTEEKRIQFLQEAAIMGQFKHPNVITLHGVLLESKQVKSMMFYYYPVSILFFPFPAIDDDCSWNDEDWWSSCPPNFTQTSVGNTAWFTFNNHWWHCWCDTFVVFVWHLFSKVK